MRSISARRPRLEKPAADLSGFAAPTPQISLFRSNLLFMIELCQSKGWRRANSTTIVGRHFRARSKAAAINRACSTAVKSSSSFHRDRSSGGFFEERGKQILVATPALNSPRKWPRAKGCKTLGVRFISTRRIKTSATRIKA